MSTLYKNKLLTKFRAEIQKKAQTDLTSMSLGQMSVINTDIPHNNSVKRTEFSKVLDQCYDYFLDSSIPPPNILKPSIPPLLYAIPLVLIPSGNSALQTNSSLYSKPIFCNKLFLLNSPYNPLRKSQITSHITLFRWHLHVRNLSSLNRFLSVHSILNGGVFNDIYRAHLNTATCELF